MSLQHVLQFNEIEKSEIFFTFIFYNIVSFCLSDEKVCANVITARANHFIFPDKS